MKLAVTASERAKTINRRAEAAHRLKNFAGSDQAEGDKTKLGRTSGRMFLRIPMNYKIAVKVGVREDVRYFIRQCAFAIEIFTGTR